VSSPFIMAAFAAATVAAQPPVDYDPRIEQALPSRAEIEGMGAALDRLVGALLTVDVGPIIDAQDPFRRNPDHGRPGRTLRDMGERDDPYFEERLRSQVRGATVGTAAMMEAFARMAPALRQSLEEVRRAVDAAGADMPLPPDADDHDDGPQE
jgi:hypothetical protein